MIVIPTWQVILNPSEDKPKRQMLRVPEDELRHFINVLIFNGVDDFHVIREDSP